MGREWRRYRAVVATDMVSAVSEFEIAINARDGAGAAAALEQIRMLFTEASEDDVRASGPRLAAVLPDVPRGPDGMVALLVGACVERGADPVVCASSVLEGLRIAVEAASEFCRRWLLADGEELPEPTLGDPPADVLERVGGADDRDARWCAMGWWTFPQWEHASAAVLSHQAVRLRFLPQPELVALTSTLVAASGAGRVLMSGLQLLDDERLTVIHRPSGEGFEFTMGGVADNFQLHTLLAAELVIPGHVPGTPPTAEAIAACHGASADAPVEYQATGSFNLVAPDGTWIWNEGTPSDIPVVGGVRLLILDPPPYERAWSAGRLFPAVTAQLNLQRQLTPSQVADYLQHVADPVEVSACASSEPPGRRWWRRRK